MSTAIARRGWLQAVLLLSLIAALLSPSLGAGFLWDDFSQIVDSPTIGDLSRVPYYFTHNVVQSSGGEGRGADGVDTFRPLFMVTLAAVYAVNGPDPWWFHLAVLAAHLLVCVLLWSLAVRWLESRAAAALAVLFFACHPVTAEAYLWPSAVSEPLAAAGLLGALLLLERRPGPHGSGATAGAAILAGAVFLLGLLTKEVVLTSLPAATLFLILGRRVLPSRVLPLWLAGVAFLVLRWFALGGLQAAGADAAQRLAALKVYPVLVVQGFSAMLAMRPVGIRHLSWEYAGLGWQTSLLAGGACLLILAAALGLRRSAPLAPTAVLTTLLMLGPIAMVATVPGWGGFGRYLYLPLAFSALALAELGLAAHGELVRRRPRLRWAVPAVVVLVLLVEQLGLRHALWVYRSQENLARTAIELFPDGPDGWEWLGNVYLDREDLPAALECYRAATERGPELFRPRHNLAAALLYTGHPAEALEQLEILDSLHPPTSDGAQIAVTALIELGQWDEAASRLVAALDRDPGSSELEVLAARLVGEHPQPDRLRAVLLEELAHPEHQRAAQRLNDMLGP